MNCMRCNAPLIDKARFCPQCGSPVSTKPSPEQAVSSPPLTPHVENPVTPERPALPPMWPPTQPMSQQSPPLQPQPWQPTQAMPSPPPSPPVPFYQGQRVQTPAAATNAPETPRQRNRRRGFIPGCLITLVLLVIIAGAGWVFALRPYLRSVAISHINQTISNRINEIPSFIPIPARPLPITDSMLNTLAARAASSSGPIQHLQAAITPAGLRLDFQVYGLLPATITGVPTASDGQLVLTNVTDSGAIALILSPSDLTTLFNQQFAAALAHIHRNVKSVTLKNRQMDLVLV